MGEWWRERKLEKRLRKEPRSKPCHHFGTFAAAAVAAGNGPKEVEHQEVEGGHSCHTEAADRKGDTAAAVLRRASGRRLPYH